MPLIRQTKAEDAPLTPEEKRTRRQIRGYIVFSFAVALALALGWKLRHALGIIYVSALFAVVLMPLVEQVQKLRVGKYRPSRTVGVVVLVVGVFLVLTTFLVLALPPVLHDVQSSLHDLPAKIPDLVAKVKKLPMADKLGVDDLAKKAEDAAGALGSYLIASAPAWLARFLDLIEAMILCIYFMLEGEFAYYYFLALWPSDSRKRLGDTLLRAEVRVSKWLIGQGTLMLILGVSSTIVFWLLHVRYFFLLGMLMGLFNIIPVAGGMITILLSGGVAALDSWPKMAGVFIFYAIYIQIENAYLTPRIMKASVNLLGLAVLIALLCGTTFAGVVGAMVAVPTAGLIAVLMDEYMVEDDPEALMEAATAKEKA